VKKCVFINLARATDRRASVEASFAAAQTSGQAAGWTLNRFEAKTPDDVAKVPGALTPVEKACFESHRSVVAKHRESSDPLFVVEDDALFSARAFGVLDHFLATTDNDIVFTDVALCDLPTMVQAASRRDAMAAQGQFTVMDLSRPSYFGSTAYAVRAGAKRKLHAALQAAGSLDTPYDLYLRDLARSGKLKVGVVFPFLTTVAAEGDASAIQSETAAPFDRLMNAFRRLMYVDRDLTAVRQDLLRLRKGYSSESADLVGQVFATMVAPGFPIDR
jgi:GR25 family glycosyltransferase involved in LPS biosynthesis